MNLEDHLGDIIGKARLMTGVSAGAAAKAAGLTEAELADLEASGNASKEFNLSALAQRIGLNAAKLEKIAKGWRPAEVNLGGWVELRKITTIEGYSVNCHLVWDEISREAALFDTGWDAAPVLKLIEENDLQLKHLFITHMHEDQASSAQRFLWNNLGGGWLRVEF